MNREDTPAWTRLAVPEKCLRAVIRTQGFKTRYGSLASHPYNPDEPYTSTWWLFHPTRHGGNWPAYHLGKFMFRPRKNGLELFVGLHVEKGIGKALAEALGTRRAFTLQMGKNWLWHSFLNDLTDGSVERALREIRERSGRSPLVVLDAGPEGDENRFHPARARYEFQNPESDHLILLRHIPGDYAIPYAENALSLNDLRERLERVTGPQGDMIWVNLMIGLSVSCQPISQVPPWDGDDFWHKVLAPLARWVRSH